MNQQTDNLQFSVDAEACIACESCIKDCPFHVMEMRGEIPYIFDEDNCLRCMHCYAICPTGAISILGKSPDQATPLKGNLPGFDQVETLIKGRRSIRRYKKDNLAPEDMQRLLEAAWHAPTGVNSQALQLTVIDSYDAMQELSKECFERIAVLETSGNMPGGLLQDYFEMALKFYREMNVDIIFRGAPHAIITSAPKDSASPSADTMISLSYFELAAQSLGLGTLWNGLLKNTIEDVFPDLRTKLGIPKDHLIGYTMLFGKPAMHYQRTVERGPAKVHRVRL